MSLKSAKEPLRAWNGRSNSRDGLVAKGSREEARVVPGAKDEAQQLWVYATSVSEIEMTACISSICVYYRFARVCYHLPVLCATLAPFCSCF